MLAGMTSERDNATWCDSAADAVSRLAPRDVCVAFTGYRPEKFRAEWPDGDVERRVRGLLRPAIEKLYGEGKRCFLCGMADGFDLWAAAEVLALRDVGRCPEAELVAVVPFAGHGDRCGATFRAVYAEVMVRAARRVVLAEGYAADTFRRRNDFLVDHASAVLCFYTGRPGGTAYTVARARRTGVPVTNLADPVLPLFG